MFNTVKEVHIAVENGLQHITSNRKQSIKAEYIDIALNMSVLQYIDNALTPEKNVTGKGYEHNQVMYDELSPLRNSTSLPVYKNDSEYFSFLPSDYKNHVSSNTLIRFNRAIDTVNVQTVNKFKYIMPLNLYQEGDEFYKGFSLRFKDIVYSPNLNIFSVDGRFILINDVIRHFSNNKQFEVYWQSYGNEYYSESFIIVSDEDYEPEWIYIGYNNETVKHISNKETVELNKVNETHNKVASNEIIRSVAKSYVNTNEYYQRNGHKHLYLSIFNNAIYLPHGDTFIPVSINMDYIKVPRMIDYKTNTLSELKINDKIVSLAVQYLMALVKDEGYNYILQENKTI